MCHLFFQILKSSNHKYCWSVKESYSISSFLIHLVIIKFEGGWFGWAIQRKKRVIVWILCRSLFMLYPGTQKHTRNRVYTPRYSILLIGSGCDLLVLCFPFLMNFWWSLISRNIFCCFSHNKIKYNSFL